MSAKSACDQYNTEAHKFLPEIFSQLAVLHLLAGRMHEEAYGYAKKLSDLDVKFGEAIIEGEKNATRGAALLCALWDKSEELQFGINLLFGGKLRSSGD